MSDPVVERTRQRRARGKRIAVMGVALPLLAASLLIWSASGRESRIDRVPVAIVNNDTIITDPQPMAAGRSLTSALTHPATPSQNLQWVMTDGDDAEAGLRDGSYYAVLTIPSDFSSSILSTATSSPAQGRLTLESNAAASTTIPYISEAVARAAAASLGDQVTQGYLGNVYDGFNSLAQANEKAASSAAQLADGTGQLSSGAGQLEGGAETLAGSLDDVASGSAQLADGAAAVSDGATQVRDGTEELARGVRALDDGQAAVSSGARTLARDSVGLAARSRALAGASRLLGLGTRGVAGGTRLLALDVRALSLACRRAGGSTRFCVALARAGERADRLAAAADRVGTGSERLADGASRLASGAGGLARGNVRLAASSQELSTAGGRLSRSTTDLVEGAGSVAEGATGLDGAAGELAQGTRAAAEAGVSVASGSSDLASSAGQVDGGARDLSSGLASGAAQSPTYSDEQQQALAPVVSQPVLLSSTVQHAEHGNGWLIAVIVGLILWLAALVAALSGDLSRVVRNAAAPVTSRRLAASQALPVIGLGVLQSGAVVAALLVFHHSTAAVVPLVLLMLLTSATFCLLALALRLGWGRVGVTLFVLFLVLQLAASGNVVPLETAPGVLQTLNAALPLTAFVNGASQLVSGGHVASYVGVVAVLLAWALLAGAALVSAVKRQRLRDTEPPGRVVLEAV